MAGFSAVLAVVAGTRFATNRRKKGEMAWESRSGALMLIGAGGFVVFSVWSMVFAVGPERGFLAENVPTIADLQTQLLGLEEDVEAIRTTTGETATQVAAMATAQAQGFAALQAGQGTLVSNPTTPQEWYSNARLYELQGNTLKAIEAYEGYFAFGLDFVVPYLQYTRLLRVTEGLARARQAVRNLQAQRPDSPTLETVLVTLLEDPLEQTDRLELLTQRQPTFAPAFYELGLVYAQRMLTTPTNDLIQKHQAAFGRALELEQTQGYSRFYIDKTLADTNLESARARVQAYAVSQGFMSNVQIQVNDFVDGTRFIIILPELGTARELRFSIDDPQPTTDTGRMGNGMVNACIGPLQLPVGDHTAYAQYVDANGVESQVYSTTFRVNEIAILFQQYPKDFATGNIPGKFSLGIRGLDVLQERCDFKYSVNKATLSATLEADSIYGRLELPNLPVGDNVLHIQAVCESGYTTPVIQFPFAVK